MIDKELLKEVMGLDDVCFEDEEDEDDEPGDAKPDAPGA